MVKGNSYYFIFELIIILLSYFFVLLIMVMCNSIVKDCYGLKLIL